jgi:hypothetical protein
MYRRILLIVAVFFGFLVGYACSSEPMPTNGNGIMLTYERSGGIAGLRDQLTIYHNGRCELQRNGSRIEFSLDSIELNRLEQLIQQANFPELKGSYLPDNSIPDAFEYVISYHTQEGSRYAVRTRTTAIPEALGPLLNELSQIVAAQS